MLVDYCSEPNRRLNALLYKADGAYSRRRALGVISLRGSEGNAMNGINIWLAPFLASKGYTTLALNKKGVQPDVHRGLHIHGHPRLVSEASHHPLHLLGDVVEGHGPSADVLLEATFKAAFFVTNYLPYFQSSLKWCSCC